MSVGSSVNVIGMPVDASEKARCSSLVIGRPAIHARNAERYCGEPVFRMRRGELCVRRVVELEQHRDVVLRLAHG